MEHLTAIAGFHDALIAPAPHPSLGRHADTYGRLIGSWTGEYEDHAPDGRIRRGGMEVHFAWVLQGRAVQDVWIAPSRAERRDGTSRSERETYGSTLRIFHADTEAWRVVWLNPTKGSRNDLVGQRVGDDIVQTGWFRDVPIKWVFTHITRDSFEWQGSVLAADGLTWRLETHFRLRRRS